MLESKMTALDVLAAIEAWTDTSPHGEARKLWIVLSALRGPDDGNEDVKEATTQHIRGACLPHLSLYGGALWNNPYNLDSAEDYIRAKGGTMSTHFRVHVSRALRVLMGKEVL